MQDRYWHNIYNKKIGIVGVLPPPIGGVSTHIKRVSNAFAQQANSVDHFDPTTQKNFFSAFICLINFLRKKKLDSIYYHAVDLQRTLLHFCMLVVFKDIFKYRLIVVEHNCRHLYMRAWLYKRCFNFLMCRVDELVLIGESTKKSYLDNAIIVPKNTRVESAFLPPVLSDEANILVSYPESLFSFMQNHVSIILANAFQLSIIHGKDLYGFDMCMHAMSRLKITYENIGLIFVLGQIGDVDYYKQIMKELVDLKIQNNIYILTGQKELWPLFKKIDVFVRPTRSDAASVSIEEALFFDVPVIASDVCPRPDKVIICKNEDVDDFCNKIKLVIGEHRNEIKHQRYIVHAKQAG